MKPKTYGIFYLFLALVCLCITAVAAFIKIKKFDIMWIVTGIHIAYAIIAIPSALVIGNKKGCSASTTFLVVSGVLFGLVALVSLAIVLVRALRVKEKSKQKTIKTPLGLTIGNGVGDFLALIYSICYIWYSKQKEEHMHREQMNNLPPVGSYHGKPVPDNTANNNHQRFPNVVNAPRSNPVSAYTPNNNNHQRFPNVVNVPTFPDLPPVPRVHPKYQKSPAMEFKFTESGDNNGQGFVPELIDYEDDHDSLDDIPNITNIPYPQQPQQPQQSQPHRRRSRSKSKSKSQSDSDDIYGAPHPNEIIAYQQQQQTAGGYTRGGPRRSSSKYSYNANAGPPATMPPPDEIDKISIHEEY